MMNRIRQLRKERGITMKELGRIVGLAESTISQYENGKREPDNKTLLMFSKYFGVSVDYILGLDLFAPEIPLDDFSFAMHCHADALTEKDKEILLQMAQQLVNANKRIGDDAAAEIDATASKLT